jgi:hypothetical protein
MKTINWTAGNEKEVEIENITETQNIADHTIMNTTDEIEVRLDGKIMIYQEIVDFEGGKAIQVMGGKIRIPADKQIEVITMVEAHRARANARYAQNAETEKKYNDHYNTVKNAMAE